MLENFTYDEKKDSPSPKIIRNHLQNCPNFRDVPAFAGRREWMTAFYLFM